jgi:hypothetical protein
MRDREGRRGRGASEDWKRKGDRGAADQPIYRASRNRRFVKDVAGATAKATATPMHNAVIQSLPFAAQSTPDFYSNIQKVIWSDVLLCFNHVEGKQ